MLCSALESFTLIVLNVLVKVYIIIDDLTKIYRSSEDRFERQSIIQTDPKLNEESFVTRSLLMRNLVAWRKPPD